MTKLAFNQINGNVVNVKDKGAVGDGVTDDTVAIQAAFDEVDGRASNQGGAVYFPSGRYAITSQVAFVGINGSLYGDGYGSTIVSKLTTTEAAVYIGDTTSSIQNAVVRDIRITGEWIEGADVNGGSTETYLLQMNECLEGKVQNVRLEFGNATGLLNSGSEMFQIDNCSFRDNAADGFEHGLSDDTIKSPPLLRCNSSMFKDNGDSGIRLTSGGAARHVIHGCTFEGHLIGGDTAGIVCLTSNTRIKDCKFELNTKNVIFGSIAPSVTAAACDMEGCAISGGDLDFVRYNNMWVSKNSFISNGTQGEPTVTFGVEESNKYSYFNQNQILSSNITNNATDGKIVIQDLMEGSASDRQSTFTDADATPDVSSSTVFRTANTGATSITNFEFGYTGKVIAIIAGDANTTIVDGSLINLSTGTSMTLASGDILLLHADSGTGSTAVPVWKDIGFWPVSGVTTASTGTLTVKSGSANSANMTGLYEVAPGIWVPYTTNPTP